MFDLLTVGEAMLRLSVPPERLLVDSPGFDVNVAGSEGNVAAAVAGMGFRACWLSRLTDNALGHRVAQTLVTYGVDCSRVVWTEADRVGVYYLEFGATPRPTRAVYDRAGSAASRMDDTTFPLRELVPRAKIVHLTGITAALSPGCYRLLEVILDVANENRVPVVFDVNYRSLLWESPSQCWERLAPLMRRSDTLLVTKRDAEKIFSLRGDPAEVARSLQDAFGVRRVALTAGNQVVFGREDDRHFEVAAYAVEIIDRIGAGDSFAAGVICGLLEGDFGLGLRYGVAMSALQLTLAGDLFRLSRADVVRLLQETGTIETLVR